LVCFRPVDICDTLDHSTFYVVSGVLLEQALLSVKLALDLALLLVDIKHVLRDLKRDPTESDDVSEVKLVPPLWHVSHDKPEMVVNYVFFSLVLVVWLVEVVGTLMVNHVNQLAFVLARRVTVPLLDLAGG